MPTCDGTLGLTCEGATGAKTCMAATYAADGAPCGNLGSGVVAQCQAGSCYLVPGQGEMGTCKRDAADGARCDTVLGPDCVRPSRCVVGDAGTSGVCTLPTATSCN